MRQKTGNILAEIKKRGSLCYNLSGEAGSIDASFSCWRSWKAGSPGLWGRLAGYRNDFAGIFRKSMHHEKKQSMQAGDENDFYCSW